MALHRDTQLFDKQSAKRIISYHLVSLEPNHVISPRPTSPYVSASLQYATHFATSATDVEPAGILYSSSMSAWIGHFSFFSSCSTSLIGVVPCPQARLPPSAVRSFRCRL